MKKISRRNTIKFGLLGGLAGLLGVGSSVARILTIPTPEEVEGPFYPLSDQADKDADLTKIIGRKGVAKGQHILVGGHVLDLQGQSIEDVTIEVWQANANGRYRHPHETNKAPLDPDFQGWAILRADKSGVFQFKTVLPGAYPATKGWTRPPHIHLKIHNPGHPTLITQMYFPDNPLNKTDLLFRNKTATEQSAMVARKVGQQGNLTVYEYNIVLSI